jgi:hypothetical protein
MFHRTHALLPALPPTRARLVPTLDPPSSKPLFKPNLRGIPTPRPQAILTDKIGPLSDADFDHSAGDAVVAAHDAKPWVKAAAVAVEAPKPKKRGGGFEAWKPPAAPVKAAPAPPARAAAPKLVVHPPKGAAAKGSAAPGKGSPSRTTLAWKEKTEYDAIKKDMPALTKTRDALQAEVTKLAGSSSGSYQTMEGKSVELGKVQERLDAMEMRWLELAELAGDL